MFGALRGKPIGLGHTSRRVGTHVWLCVPQIEPQVDGATADQQQQQFYIY